MSNVFQAIDTARKARSTFDLSHEYKTTFDFGQLIPISVFECVPGDVHKLGVAAVCRLQPLLAPILHSVKLRYYSFFVPYRILFDDWEEFITRGEDGQSVISLPLMDPALALAARSAFTSQQSLWDYFGFSPIALSNTDDIPVSSCPLDFPRRAYVMIWNEFFRVPGIQDEKPIELGVSGEVYQVLSKNWVRDYLTAALPFQQRGTAVALPVFGNAPVDFSGIEYQDKTARPQAEMRIPAAQTGGTKLGVIAGTNAGIGPGNSTWINDEPQFRGYWSQVGAGSTVDGSGLSSVDVADLRLAFQTQVWMERNARGGARYTEQLQARYGTRPLDMRLQRPEFIGGYTGPFLISEVLQTSASDTQPSPQGNMAGHGISVEHGMLGGYRVEEHGLIMILACVDPTPAYQQGIHRSWLRRNTLDFPAPEFVHLSEQEIFNNELFVLNNTEDPSGVIGRTPFGYTGIYNEMRYMPSRVTSEMRETFDYWHLGRKFASLPLLNSDFLNIEHELPELKRIFAVPSVPGIIGNFGIRLVSHRPIPYMAIPSGIGV